MNYINMNAARKDDISDWGTKVIIQRNAWYRDKLLPKMCDNAANVEICEIPIISEKSQCYEQCKSHNRICDEGKQWKLSFKVSKSQ